MQCKALEFHSQKKIKTTVLSRISFTRVLFKMSLSQLISDSRYSQFWGPVQARGVKSTNRPMHSNARLVVKDN